MAGDLIWTALAVVAPHTTDYVGSVFAKFNFKPTKTQTSCKRFYTLFRTLSYCEDTTNTTEENWKLKCAIIAIKLAEETNRFLFTNRNILPMERSRAKMLRFSMKAIIKQFEQHQKFLNAELKGKFTGSFLIWCAQNKKTCTKESLDEFLKFFSKEDIETIEEIFKDSDLNME